MDVDVVTDIVIASPIGDVSAFAGDPSNAPAWYVNIESVAWESPPPMHVGSRIAFVARFLGRRLSYTYEIVDEVPGKRLVMRTSEGPFPMETTYEWAEVNGGTRMTLRNRGRPGGFSRLLSPFMPMAMKRANRNDLKRLKVLLESR